MIVMVNSQGQVVRQINGLASRWDRAAGRWRCKPVGYLSSDRLRGYDTGRHPDTWLPIHGMEARWNVAAALARGDVARLASAPSQARAEALLAPALEALCAVNALSDGPEGGGGVAYPFLGFGPNSNSFFSTLLAAMELAEPVWSRPARLVPGAGALLLPKGELAAIVNRARGRLSA